MRIWFAGFTLLWFLCCAAYAQAPADAPDLTISEAVRLALAQNLNIRSARLEAAAARERIDAARSGFFPQVAANARYTYNTNVPTIEVPFPTEEEITLSSRDNLTAAVTTRLALYTGGRVRAQTNEAEARYDAAVATLAATEAQVAFRTRAAFYDVLLNQGLVVSNEQTLAAARAQLDAAQARFEVGTAAQFDVLRAETQVSEAEQAITEARNRVQTSRVVLNRILGVDLGRDYDLIEPPRAPTPTQDVCALIALAVGQRAEILAATAQVEAAEAGISIARSQRRPELDVLATYEWVQTETPGQASGWVFAAVLDWEIFSGGRIGANIREAQALTELAETNLEDTTRAVDEEVRLTYADVFTAAQNIETARARLAQAQEAYDIAVVRYEAGVGTATEIADALAALATARTNLDRAIFNYNLAYAALQRSLGNVTY